MYCVPNVDELVASNRNEDFPYLTMVEGLSDQWYLMYECLTTAARINFQVSSLAWPRDLKVEIGMTELKWSSEQEPDVWKYVH